MFLKNNDLKYDGSHLGSHEFGDVIDLVHPCPNIKKRSVPVFFANLYIYGRVFPVIIKLNKSQKLDQVVIDELKPVFGLDKIGTHRIRLKGVPKTSNSDWELQCRNKTIELNSRWGEYLIFKAKVENGAFISSRPLNEISWIPSSRSDVTSTHRYIYHEVQKILVYKKIFLVKNVDMSDILVRIIPELELLSADEMEMLYPNEPGNNIKKTHLPKDLENFFFKRAVTQFQVLIKMLNMTNKNYMARIEVIHESMIKIIKRIDENYVWLIDQTVNTLINSISSYYSLTT